MQPGIGLYAGLNAGTDLASGTWYYFMGCDDEFYRYDTLTIMAEVAQNCSEKILTGKVKYTNGYIMTPALGSPHFMKFVLHHQGTFYHKDIFDKYRYSEELTIASDYELNVKLGLAKVPFRFLSTIIALYGDNGISSTQYKANFAEVSIVNRRLFTGLPRAWVICFCKVKHSVWLIRNKLGLLNIKSRMKGALRLHKQYSL